MSSNYGFVYILSNDALPGVFKVGMTKGSPMARAAQLSSSTSIPSPFVVEYYGEFLDPRGVEVWAHKTLSGVRVNNGREFFSCNLAVIVEVIESAGPESSWWSAEADFAKYKAGGKLEGLIQKMHEASSMLDDCVEVAV